MSKTKTISIAIIALFIGAFGTYFSTTKLMTNTDNTAENGDLVAVNYTGKLENGTVFDSSVLPVNGQPARNKPIQFFLGKSMVIKGWDEGILGMHIGEKRTLTITSDKAYGTQGVPDGKGGYLIPPNATLIFDVELVDAMRSVKPTEQK